MDGSSTAVAPATALLRRPAVVAAAAVAAITAVRLAFLAVSPLNLFVDEAQYWAWSRHFAWGYFSKPPLIAWLIGATTALCGNGEACVRLPAPLFYAATSAVVFLLARALYDARIAAWSAVVFATLPGVSFSSIIISTDVPLLFFWACALLALWRLAHGGGAGSAVALGAAVGLATLAKYAGAYFLVCAAAWMAADRDARAALLSRRGALALGVFLAAIAPNLAWNAAHGFATIGHTAGLALGDGPSFRVLPVLEFYGAQFAVFGPLPFAALSVLAARWAVRRAGSAERMLLCFALPVLGLMLAEAFVVRAYANWAAVAYVAAAVLVTATLARSWARALRAMALLHGAVAVAAYAWIAAGGTLGGLTFGRSDPLDRVTGWDRLAAEIGARARDYPGASLMADERTIAATLLYYLRDMLRDEARPLVAWDPERSDPMLAALAPAVDRATGRDVLYVPGVFPTGAAAAAFARAEELPRVGALIRPGTARAVRLIHLQGYRGP